jgi:hypothetical protein
MTAGDNIPKGNPSATKPLDESVPAHAASASTPVRQISDLKRLPWTYYAHCDVLKSDGSISAHCEVNSTPILGGSRSGFNSVFACQEAPNCGHYWIHSDGTQVKDSSYDYCRQANVPKNTLTTPRTECPKSPGLGCNVLPICDELSLCTGSGPKNGNNQISDCTVILFWASCPDLTPAQQKVVCDDPRVSVYSSLRRIMACASYFPLLHTATRVARLQVRHYVYNLLRFVILAVILSMFRRTVLRDWIFLTVVLRVPQMWENQYLRWRTVLLQVWIRAKHQTTR